MAGSNPAAEPAPGATDAFLSGQGIPVPLADVEGELARLWGPSAERADGPDLDNPTVTRVSLANLVVACLDPVDSAVEEALDQLAALRPSRVLVLRGTDSPTRQVSAIVSATCRLPAPGLPQVCSERIVLEAGPTAFDLLPGTMLSLLEPGLPLELWWVGDPSRHLTLYRTLGAEAARLIPDLPDDALTGPALARVLDPAINPHLRDLAWFAISPWRELIAQFFDAPGAAGALGRLSDVTIVAGGPQDGPIPRIALWLAAWLAGQLGWRPERRATTAGSLTAGFRAGDRPVRVAVRCEPTSGAREPSLQRIELLSPGAEGDGDESFGLTRLPGGRGDVRLEICSACRCQLPRTVHVPDYDRAHRLAAALESSRIDEPYRAAQPILFWLLGDAPPAAPGDR